MDPELWSAAQWFGVGATAVSDIVAIGRASLLSLDAGRKRKHGLLTPPPSPQFRKQARQALSASKPNMAISRRRRGFRKRRFGRRRFQSRRTRVKRVLRSARRRRFKRSVKRIIVRSKETLKHHFTETSFTLAPGNGTTGMNVRVFAPWQAAFAQGTASNNMLGSRIRLWKFIWRLNIKGLLAGDVHVQILFIRTHIMMDVTAAGTDTNNEGQTMTPATDVDSVPTQVPPNSNIPLFDVTASPGQFAGLSPVTKFNTDEFKIIKKWDFKLHGFGQAATDPFLDTTLTFPFSKVLQVQETQATIDGVPRFFGSRRSTPGADQYYILVRTWGQDFIASGSAIDVDHRGTLLFNDDN